MAADRLMGMFPLGHVLFPGASLPLRIFEDRYLQMIDECATTGDPFGVVLIERGFEVGGGDSRFMVGTAAELVAVGGLAGGERAILARGSARIRVVEWLADDPYPRAIVRQLEEEPAANLRSDIEEAQRRLKRLLSLWSELGANVGSLSWHLPDEPAEAIYLMAARAPLSPIDAQAVLQTDRPGDRLRRLCGLLDEEISTAQAQLAAG